MVGSLLARFARKHQATSFLFNHAGTRFPVWWKRRIYLPDIFCRCWGKFVFLSCLCPSSSFTVVALCSGFSFPCHLLQIVQSSSRVLPIAYAVYRQLIFCLKYNRLPVTNKEGCGRKQCWAIAHCENESQQAMHNIASGTILTFLPNFVKSLQDSTTISSTRRLLQAFSILFCETNDMELPK